MFWASPSSQQPPLSQQPSSQISTSSQRTISEEEEKVSGWNLSNKYCQAFATNAIQRKPALFIFLAWLKEHQSYKDWPTLSLTINCLDGVLKDYKKYGHELDVFEKIHVQAAFQHIQDLREKDYMKDYRKAPMIQTGFNRSVELLSSPLLSRMLEMVR